MQEHACTRQCVGYDDNGEVTCFLVHSAAEEAMTAPAVIEQAAESV